MIKSIVSTALVLFFIFSFVSLASASLDMDSQSNLVADSAKPQLYCGLALPPDGGQSGEGDETDGTEEGTQDGSESEPDAGPQTDDQPPH